MATSLGKGVDWRALGRSINPNYAAAALVVAAITLLVALLARAAYDQVTVRTTSQLSTLSQLLEKQTEALFLSVDLTLQALELAEPVHLQPFDPGFVAVLRKRAEDLGSVRALFVTDAAGDLVQDSDPQQSSVVNLSDRSYFIALQQNPALEFVVSPPVISRTENVWSIPAARRLSTGDGSFAGILGASVEPRYLNAFYAELDVGEHAAIALFDTHDGNVLAFRTGEVANIAFEPRRFPILSGLSGSGTFHSRELDGRQRIVAYRVIPNLSLGVAVGASTSSIAMLWWHEVWPFILAALGLTILIAGLTYVLDRRQKERRENERRALTTQKLEAMGQMTGGIAHDFNNVLAAATASLRLIRSRGPRAEILDAAEQAISRGENLVRQLMSFARKRDLDIRPHDANTLIRNMDQVLKHAAGFDNRLQIALAGDLPLCWTDQTQFDAALVNLVVNARHAMPNGGTIIIATGLERIRDPNEEIQPGSYVSVVVSDTGTGMDTATMSRIFDPFFTTKGEAGTGLGLAQIYRFMHQIGGGIAVKSEVGKGSEFQLFFRADEP